MDPTTFKLADMSRHQAAIQNEREYQIRRWGIRQEDGSFMEKPNSVGDFVLYMEHYLSEARRQLTTEPSNASALDTLRKVVALGHACFEQHGVPFRKLPDSGVVNGRDGKWA